MQLDFPGVSLTVRADATILISQSPLLTLSSAVVGGGFERTRTILNRRVPLDYDCSHPVQDLQQFMAEQELPEPCVGLLTGVPMHGTRIVSVRQGEITVASVITAGVSNAVISGLTPPAVFVPGTINTVVLIDAHLVPSAMVNAVITATEAKTSVLQAYNVRTKEGNMATGTSTDALVIACTGRGEALPYAGPATEVGYLIGKSVRQCLFQALEPCGVFPTNSNERA